MTAQNAFNKSAIRNLFGKCDFPVHRNELMQIASQHDMGAPYMKALQQIPKREYSGIDDIHDTLNTGGQRPRA